ncbi:MAG: hypothetical protein ACOCZK_04340 [Planctomycetota bacterium]
MEENRSDYIPTTEQVESLKEYLGTIGLDRAEIDRIDPAVITLILRMIANHEKKNRVVEELSRTIKQHEETIERLRTQRDALQVAVRRERLLRQEDTDPGSTTNNFEELFGG